MPIPLVLTLTTALSLFLPPPTPKPFDPPPQPNYANPVDYVAWYRHQLGPPTGDDAYTLYEKLSGVGEHEKAGGIEMPEGALRKEFDDVLNAYRIWKPADHPKLVQFLTTQMKHIQTAKAAAAKPGYVLNVRFAEENDTLLVDLLLPHLAPMRTSARLLTLLAFMEQPNQSAAARDAFRIMMGISRHARQDGTLISNLVSMAIRALTYGDVRMALAEGIITPVDAQATYDTLIESDPGPGEWTSAIRYEWATLLQILQCSCPDARMDSAVVERVLKSIHGDSYQKTTLSRVMNSIDPQRTLTSINEYHSGMVQRASGARSAAWLDRLRLHCIGNLESYKTNGEHLLVSFLPNHVRGFELDLRTEADRRGTMLLLMIHAHQHKTGKWPKSLADLSGPRLSEFRIDPYTGRDYIYRGTPDGFTLYSEGIDADDDNGRHHPRYGEPEKQSDKPDGDFVFWPRPTDNSN
jgi:hypothetical protein